MFNLELFKKRLFASGVLAFLIAYCTLTGTLAYLLDYTDSIGNVFTSGEVDISLTESVVNDHGVPVTPAARTSSGQTYKLVPGRSYVKDPVVTVEADSVPCYVYILVDNPVTAIEDVTAGTVASQIASNGWSTLSGSSGTLYYNDRALTATQTLYYKAVSASSSDQDLATFTTFNTDLWADVTTAGGLSLDITAFAIQQDSFASAAEAWETTFGYHYDPTVDYDFGTSLQVASSSQRGGVPIEEALGGNSCKVELHFYRDMASSGNRGPIFISNYICITANSSGYCRLWVRDSVNGNSYMADDFGVDGLWRLIAIGGWRTTFTVVADGPNVWVNGNLVESNAECYGWGDYEPQIWGIDPADGAHTMGLFYSAKLYTDGELVKELYPAREKLTQYIGLFDLVENIFYRANGMIFNP